MGYGCGWVACGAPVLVTFGFVLIADPANDYGGVLFTYLGGLLGLSQSGYDVAAAGWTVAVKIMHDLVVWETCVGNSLFASALLLQAPIYQDDLVTSAYLDVASSGYGVPAPGMAQPAAEPGVHSGFLLGPHFHVLNPSFD